VSSDAHVTVADNADFGLNAETAATERWPIERVQDNGDAPDWYDGRFVADLESDLGGVIVGEGTLVESKACRREYRERRGRWWIRRRNHQKLLEADGEYVLAVYDPTGEILRQGLVSASTIDAIVDGNWWDAGAGGNQAEEYVQLPWSAVFEDLEVA